MIKYFQNKFTLILIFFLCCCLNVYSNNNINIGSLKATANLDKNGKLQKTNHSQGSSSCSSEDDDVLAQLEEKVKSECKIESTAYRVDGINSFCHEHNNQKLKSPAAIKEPQMSSMHGEWKGYTLGRGRTAGHASESFANSDIKPYSVEKIETNEEKVFKVSKELKGVRRAFKKCRTIGSNVEDLIALNDLVIKESYTLNNFLQEAKYEIQQIVYDGDGLIKKGSGAFVGIRSTKDEAKINRVLDRFENYSEQWKNSNISIREDIVRDLQKTSPKYAKNKSYNEKWESKLKSNSFNQDLRSCIKM